MTLQAKLTLGTVLLTTVIVVVVSAVDLGNIMDLRFQTALHSADRVADIVVGDVREALNSHPELPLEDALANSRLHEQMEAVVTQEEIFAVTVVDSHGRILADSRPEPREDMSTRYGGFEHLVNDTGWYEKTQILSSHSGNRYQVERELGPPTIFVRVVVAPAFIREYMKPALHDNANTALICVGGAICLTFLFSTFAFRPLGRLRRQLDLLASGQFEQEAAASKPSTDELSIMSSKVSLLGERLRGAQFEVSDLRGNIDRLLQELEDAVLIFNRENRLVFASGAVARFLGRERADLSGVALAELFPPSSNLGFLIAQTLETGLELRDRRIPVQLGDAATSGSVVLSVDLLQDEAGIRTGLLVRMRDPEAQRQIGRQLQTADRLAAISRISGGVAHEVKNPLNAILLHVEVAKTRLARGEADVTPQMEVISREILRLDRVVKTFLDFTRPVELNYRVVPLREVLDEIVDLARPQAESENIRMVVEQTPEDVAVKVDRDMFKQAMLNVVVNAMQAMKGGGELRLKSTVTDDNVEVLISDTGAGIPPELREKIFRLYFTTKQGGSGIGLAMTFRIVQLHDGTIDFSSEPGKGTTFVIRLPIAV